MTCVERIRATSPSICDPDCRSRSVIQIQTPSICDHRLRIVWVRRTRRGCRTSGQLAGDVLSLDGAGWGLQGHRLCWLLRLVSCSGSARESRMRIPPADKLKHRSHYCLGVTLRICPDGSLACRRDAPSACSVGMIRRHVSSACAPSGWLIGMLLWRGSSAWSVGMFRRHAPWTCSTHCTYVGTHAHAQHNAFSSHTPND